jgi:hypothetical protein
MATLGSRRPYRVTVSRRATIFAAFVMLGGTAFLTWGAVFGSLWERLLYVPLAIFALVVTITCFFRARRRSWQVVGVRDEGLELPSTGLVTWDEIELVEFKALPGGDRGLAVWPRDPGDVARRARGLHRLDLSVGALLGQPLVIPEVVADLDELKREIDARRSAAR